ncbi:MULTISPECIES: polyphosphate kinase 2 family protein [Pontibacillus]|uniref:UDP-galactose-lipid carrier transferase n=1 Tax=Pontibacillus chungwhensis TaxID=265426 RepID=A0ABY8USZ1_9BACI|nr:MULTISPECIES: UDP-galactose-lipid carrier transferase [Pontibacillus]MCD5323232.1 UDP-galactose-lipid carrier transferase [Pontibacillus sp. HN14]WIF96619.1 UDP-galactose-lipid carrier transferase [Pontibacillus chungwhensis]
MLESVDLSLQIDDKKQYKKELKQTQVELLQLQRMLVDHKLGVLIVCEGWDAAGKGGAIKRLTSGLDPRGFSVHPISAPSSNEKRHHYLKRFWTKVPAYGEIGIFDRSWYGRVLVERVEGFADYSEWNRAYHEINDFEKLLVQDQYIVIKLWFHISNEEQLRRFKEREADPLKQWKITKEDWRNREKWDQYVAAVEDMLDKTSTAETKWHVIEGEDKYYARVKTNRTIIKEIRARLHQLTPNQ